jgi:hypothetical protein
VAFGITGSEAKSDELLERVQGLPQLIRIPGQIGELFHGQQLFH